MSLYQHFIEEAYLQAQNSPDPSTQNGALIVKFGYETEIIGRACNTFPPGVEKTPERLVRPLKYQFVEHAERGAIYDAARNGKSTVGATMFVPWAACADCGRAIICAGISKVVVHRRMMDATPDHWKESIKSAMIMLSEAGVVIDYLETGIINEKYAIRFNESKWVP